MEKVKKGICPDNETVYREEKKKDKGRKKNERTWKKSWDTKKRNTEQVELEEKRKQEGQQKEEEM